MLYSVAVGLSSEIGESRRTELGSRYWGRPAKRSVQANEGHPHPFDVLATGHFS